MQQAEENNGNSNRLRAALVGGGLVGALEACLLANRGFDVTLFEARHDGRNEPSYYGRSINLAISHRGISALKRLGLEGVVEERAIPMRARMIHKPNGKTHPIPYDPDGRCINSIERAGLNNFLLDKAEQEFKVKILFNHKLVDMNAEEGRLMFRLREADSEEAKQRLLSYQFDLILGCDGARSSVRSLLARQSEMELEQRYIEHGYLELRIDPKEEPAESGGTSFSFRMDPNCLHIWPRGQYMMIALPNKDRSFTCTLFMPFKILEGLRDPERALGFFERNFPDSIELIGAERIMRTLSEVKASSLISIKCRPYSYKDKVVLLGDAAHAMVPFYGQGMNCGFEDCLVLDEMLDKHQVIGDRLAGEPSEVAKLAIKEALEEYGSQRCANGYSMCDLAMYNYVEMRDLVNTWSFFLRKQVDNILYRMFPSRWIPLYTMVTFSRIPIDECVRRRQEQDKVLARLATLSMGFSLAAIAFLGAKRLSSRASMD